MASLAGIPPEVVSAGGQAAAEMERKLAGAFDGSRRESAVILRPAEEQAVAQICASPAADSTSLSESRAGLVALWNDLQVQAAA